MKFIKKTQLSSNDQYFAFFNALTRFSTAKLQSPAFYFPQLLSYPQNTIACNDVCKHPPVVPGPLRYKASISSIYLTTLYFYLLMNSPPLCNISLEGQPLEFKACTILAPSSTDTFFLPPYPSAIVVSYTEREKLPAFPQTDFPSLAIIAPH